MVEGEIRFVLNLRYHWKSSYCIDVHVKLNNLISLECLYLTKRFSFGPIVKHGIVLELQSIYMFQ